MKYSDPAAQAMWDRAWRELDCATRSRKHAFRTGAFATVESGAPRVRTMTLRSAANGRLSTNCDVRSPKISHIRSGSAAEWLFYDQPNRLQVRAFGKVEIHHLDEHADKVWSALPLLSRRCYLAPYAPSTLVEGPETNLPAGLTGRQPTDEESAPGRSNFAVLVLGLERLEVYEMEYFGGRRCQFSGGDFRWLAP